MYSVQLVRSKVGPSKLIFKSADDSEIILQIHTSSETIEVNNSVYAFKRFRLEIKKDHLTGHWFVYIDEPIFKITLTLSDEAYINLMNDLTTITQIVSQGRLMGGKKKKYKKSKSIKKRKSRDY